MIPRYTNPEMGAIWSDQRRYETWLEVELAATDAMAEAGLVPADAARELRQHAAFDQKRNADETFRSADQFEDFDLFPALRERITNDKGDHEQRAREQHAQK